MDCSPPGSSVHWIIQARRLDWIIISSSRGSSRPRNRTCNSCISCIGRLILHWYATGRPKRESVSHSLVSDSLWTFLCSHLQSHISPSSVLLLTLAFPSCIALPLESYLFDILSFRLCWKNTSFILFSQTFSLTQLSRLDSKYTLLLCFLHITVWIYLLNIFVYLLIIIYLFH